MKNMIRIVLVLFATLSLTACWESDTENAIEDMGEKVEETTEDAGDQLEEGAEEVEDAVEGDDLFH